MIVLKVVGLTTKKGNTNIRAILKNEALQEIKEEVNPKNKEQQQLPVKGKECGQV